MSESKSAQAASSVTASEAHNGAVNQVLDVTGLPCPMPLLKAKLALNQMAAGERIKVLATDPGSIRDFASFISLSDHTMVESHTHEEPYTYIIERG